MNEHTRDRLLVTGLGLIACAAGLVLASQRGTWTDEAATIFAVSKPLGEMLRDTVAVSQERENSGYWLLPWVRVKGVTISGK